MASTETLFDSLNSTKHYSDSIRTSSKREARQDLAGFFNSVLSGLSQNRAHVNRVIILRFPNVSGQVRADKKRLLFTLVTRENLENTDGQFVVWMSVFFMLQHELTHNHETLQ